MIEYTESLKWSELNDMIALDENELNDAKRAT